MLKIGEFSKLSRVSIRMLRHYDELGLLTPGAVDECTGYRYYSEGQLVRMNRITALRAMGFSLAAIRDLLDHWEDRKDLARHLQVRREEAKEAAKEAEWRLRLLDTALERLRKDDNSMKYDVTLKTLPERYVASVRMTIPCYEQEGEVWRILCEETDRMHLQPTDPCYCSVVFHDEGFKESDVDVEAQKTVKGQYPDTEHVRFRTVPEVTFAACTYKGSYDKITEVNEAVAAWVESNGYVYDGPAFNIYHVSPHETHNPEEFVTEVCYPVRRN